MTRVRFASPALINRFESAGKLCSRRARKLIWRRTEFPETDVATPRDHCRCRPDAIRDCSRCRAAASAEAARAGRLLPAWLYFIRIVLHAVAGRSRRHRQTAQRDVSLGMDIERQLLLAEWPPLLDAILADAQTRVGEPDLWRMER